MRFQPGFASQGHSLLWLGANGSSSNQTTYNFGSFTAPVGGLMIACFVAGGADSRTVSSCSIGGSAATLDESGSSSQEKVAVASRSVSAGSHNVTVTLSGANGTNGAAAVGIFLLVAPATGYTASQSSSAADSAQRTVSFNIPASGYAVYGAMRAFNSDDAAWSSADERYDATHGNIRATFASKFSAVAIAPHSETVTFTSSGSRSRSVGAAYQ